MGRFGFTRTLLFIFATILSSAVLQGCRSTKPIEETPPNKEKAANQVSLCVITDNFLNDEYQRLRVVFGRASVWFEDFDIEFYVHKHIDQDVPDVFGVKEIAKWKRNFLTPYTSTATCNVVVVVTNKNLIFPETGDDYAGIFQGSGNVMGIAIDQFSSRSLYYLEIVTAHELGHVFGAQHATSTDSIMFASVSIYANGWDEISARVIYENRKKFTLE